MAEERYFTRRGSCIFRTFWLTLFLVFVSNSKNLPLVSARSATPMPPSVKQLFDKSLFDTTPTWNSSVLSILSDNGASLRAPLQSRDNQMQFFLRNEPQNSQWSECCAWYAQHFSQHSFYIFFDDIASSLASASPFSIKSGRTEVNLPNSALGMINKKCSTLSLIAVRLPQNISCLFTTSVLSSCFNTHHSEKTSNHRWWLFEISFTTKNDAICLSEQKTPFFILHSWRRCFSNKGRTLKNWLDYRWNFSYPANI